MLILIYRLSDFNIIGSTYTGELFRNLDPPYGNLNNVDLIGENYMVLLYEKSFKIF
jgi:hypothetical protein